MEGALRYCSASGPGKTYKVDMPAGVVWGMLGYVSAAGADGRRLSLPMACGWCIQFSRQALTAPTPIIAVPFRAITPADRKFVLVDGSVHFLNENIDHNDATSSSLVTSTYSKLLSADDGGTVECLLTCKNPSLPRRVDDGSLTRWL